MEGPPCLLPLSQESRAEGAGYPCAANRGPPLAALGPRPAQLSPAGRPSGPIPAASVAGIASRCAPCEPVGAPQLILTNCLITFLSTASYLFFLRCAAYDRVDAALSRVNPLSCFLPLLPCTTTRGPGPSPPPPKPVAAPLLRRGPARKQAGRGASGAGGAQLSGAGRGRRARRAAGGQAGPSSRITPRPDSGRASFPPWPTSRLPGRGPEAGARAGRGGRGDRPGGPP